VSAAAAVELVDADPTFSSDDEFLANDIFHISGDYLTGNRPNSL